MDLRCGLAKGILGLTERDVVGTDQTNEEFWNELCGTSLARSLGINDHSKESLERFDRAYLEFYPYLLKYVDLDYLGGRRVLEIGLGYGTLGQKIAEAGADYVGLDIAEVPVRMICHRLQLHGLGGFGLRGSALRLPFAANCMDSVVSIGCLHHTGNVQQGVDEIYRVLKRGGRAVLMVYNQFSYRQWARWPTSTLRAWLRDLGLVLEEASVTEAQRRTYDSDAAGQAAPETVFLSIRRLRQMLGRFSRVEFRKENNENLLSFPRACLLPYLGRSLGLDIYIQTEK
jgi:SAM-dependent methyltransferase